MPATKLNNEPGEILKFAAERGIQPLSRQVVRQGSATAAYLIDGRIVRFTILHQSIALGGDAIRENSVGRTIISAPERYEFSASALADAGLELCSGVTETRD